MERATHKPVLELRDVAKHYDRAGQRLTVIERVSLQVRRESFSVIRGPSGSGKTTLLLAAGGLLHPNTGKVLVQGQDLYALSAEQRSVFRGTNIGFVFQQFHLIPYLTVLDNVRMPGIALPIPNLEPRARELLEQFRLGPRLGHFPAELSTGERQRVALARALIAQPALLLADEPTGNLDLENEHVILDRLWEYVRGGGAVVMATHGLRADGFDDVYLLRDGALQPERSPASHGTPNPGPCAPGN
jgi:putative ABC transport system ATP-binding protein